MAPALHLSGDMRTHRFAIGTVLALVVLVVTPAIAGAPTEQLRQRIDQVIKVLDEPALRDKPPERQAAIRKIAEDIFDYPDAARRALGAHWSARAPQEREEFVRLFADVLDRAYVSKIDLYQGEKVGYLGDTIDADQATVKTRIATKKGSEVPIDYRMHLNNGRWLVYDVIIEGVSLVANYRNQFNKIVQTESYQALVDKLRSKDAAPAASPRETPRSQ
jgi:phospholipid transport system substrate-binding protein